MKHLLYISAGILLLVMCLLLTSQKQQGAIAQTHTTVTEDDTTPHEKSKAIYYWRTTFNLSEQEQQFLQKHDINKLYVRMFDVALEREEMSDIWEVVPIATTQFISEVPQNISIIPTTYITVDALRDMQYNEERYAKLIVERLLAMARYNKCGEIKEVQFDCDWTQTTQSIYFELCEKAANLLHEKDIELSITVRLHQISSEAPYYVDKGVLMVYNTGNFKSTRTRNSILDIEDIKPYLKARDYPLPLDYAYPTFGWGIKFYNNDFEKIVTNPEYELLTEAEYIRIERPTTAQILEVKNAVEKTFGKPASGNIIYHLDQKQLSNYKDHEIAQILSYN